jgi:hypothetical protein
MINKGYNIRKGGCGNVNAIVTAHPILSSQAKISKINLSGHSTKSRLAQLKMCTVKKLNQFDRFGA